MRQGDLTNGETAPATAVLRQARSSRDIDDARRLFIEYADWLKIDLCFQDFDRELATLPGAYAPPRGRLLLAGEPGEAFACIALRPLDWVRLDVRGCASMLQGCGGSGAIAQEVESWPAPERGRAAPEVQSHLVGEVKRLYVQPAQRGLGWGERLARAVVQEAHAIGYRELRLDTFAWMGEARALYARLGFRECAPYYDNPHDGVVYMSLELSSPPRNRERASASETLR